MAPDDSAGAAVARRGRRALHGGPVRPIPPVRGKCRAQRDKRGRDHRPLRIETNVQRIRWGGGLPPAARGRRNPPGPSGHPPLTRGAYSAGGQRPPLHGAPGRRALHDKAKRRVCPYNLPAQRAFVARFHTFNGKTRAFFFPIAPKDAKTPRRCRGGALLYIGGTAFTPEWRPCRRRTPAGHALESSTKKRFSLPPFTW